jgi:plastocyanin
MPVRRLILATVLFVGGVLLTPLAASAATSSARIVNCPPAIGCFRPDPIQIKVGDTVTWTNNAGTTHTATSDTGAWDTGNLAPGATSNAVPFPTAGTFAYHCAIHPSMVGAVVVSGAAPAASAPPVGLAQGGGGPQFPIGAALLLLGLGSLAARSVRRHRTQRVGERIDKSPHE